MRREGGAILTSRHTDTKGQWTPSLDWIIVSRGVLLRKERHRPHTCNRSRRRRIHPRVST